MAPCVAFGAQAHSSGRKRPGAEYGQSGLFGRAIGRRGRSLGLPGYALAFFGGNEVGKLVVMRVLTRGMMAT